MPLGVIRSGRYLRVLSRKGATKPFGLRPRIQSIVPNRGPAAGGTTVTITGGNFFDPDTGVSWISAVNFGATPAASFSVTSDNQITATSPAGTAGASVLITVINPKGAGSGRFTYEPIPVPVVTSLNPISGLPAGGTTVTINGTNFTPASTVAFGATAATGVTFVSATQLTAVSPAGTGAVNVRVTTVEGTSALAAGNLFTYTSLAPVVTNVNPNTGPIAGGTAVTITGTNFTGVTQVNWGGTVLSAIAAPAAPTVTSINPTSGVAGAAVTITGTGFVAASGFTFVSATQINVITLPGTAGAANVTVTTPNGTSPAATFTYTAPAAPTVISVSPTSGTAGTPVTITGTGFQ